MSLIKQCKTNKENNKYLAPTPVVEYIKYTTLFDFIKRVD